MTRPPRDLAASVRDRLLLRARQRGEDFQLVLQRYAVERLLFRLAQSPDRGRFLLKGAMLYVAWSGESHRPTRDLDLLGFGPAEIEAVTASFRALCSMEVADDGLLFQPESVRAQEIRDAAEYGGIRVRLDVRLAAVRIDLQIDVGFGDAVVPGAVELEFPTLLGGPAPRIRAYPRESVIAEKLHAAVLFGDANTRLKDFYDLFTLPRLFAFEGPPLTRAIAATFERRRTDLPAVFPLRDAFFASDGRAGRWRGFLDRNGLKAAPGDLSAVGEALRDFQVQPYEALVSGVEFGATWPPGGPWQ